MLTEIVTPHWISSEMERRGYTQHGLAAELGVTERAVALWCDGSRTPNVRSMEGILRAFGYELEVHRVDAV